MGGCQIWDEGSSVAEHLFFLLHPFAPHPPTHTHTPHQHTLHTIPGVKADVDRSCLILETGVNQRWRYGGWRTSADSIEEANGWEEAKDGTR